TASGSSIRFLLSGLPKPARQFQIRYLRVARDARGLDLEIGFDSLSLAGLNPVQNRPRLGLGDRARLLDPHHVTGLVLVALVVGMIPLRATDDLAIERVTLLALDLHGHGLVGLVGDHGPDQDAFRHRLLLKPWQPSGCARSEGS